MTLTHLLGIDRSLLRPEEESGLALAERTWAESGAPRDLSALCDVLEAVLTGCTRRGILYPPILLRRKKEIQRGTWRPAEAPAVEAQPAEAVGADGGTCPHCQGRGFVCNPGGRSATLCSCGAWKKGTQARIGVN